MFQSDFVILLVILDLISINSGQWFLYGRSSTDCRLRSGEPGFCTGIKNCTYKENSVKRYERPQFCYYPFSRWVCCPKRVLDPIPGDKSRRRCQQYEEAELRKIENRFGRYRRQTTIDLGSHVFAIVGGFLSDPQEYPHMAALGYGKDEKKEWHCGGSLISDKFVLTAAHCMHHRELGELRWIRLGDLNLEVTTDVANPQDFNVTKRIAHPKYLPPSQYNDIALIELDRPAIINDFVRPACLHTVKDIIDPRPSVIGWGQTEFGGDSSPHLQKAFLSFYSLDECKKAYAKVAKTRLENGIDDETQICAGGREEQQDTCQGDSGGPLQVENFDLDSSLIYTIAGITSFGKSCGAPESPGVYTRVSAFIGWIEDTVWPDK